MSLLKKPSEIKQSVQVAGLIYGQPGLGKSTLAVSAPNAVMIDADKGLYRVEKRFQVPSLPLENYKDLLALLQSDELNGFQTIVFDTLGKLVDRMADYVKEVDVKNGQKDGSLSMKGWGAIKVEFQNLLKLAQSKNKNIIFVAHEKEEKDGETRIVRPDVSGSSGKDLVKDMDFVGYMESKGNKRTISFTPCEKFYAKNSLKLPESIEVPNTDKNSNDFIQKFIIEKTIERLAEDDVQNAKYVKVVEANAAHIAAVNGAESANQALKAILAAESIWDSLRVAKAALNKKTTELGLVYDKDAGSFKEKPQQQAA